MSFISQRWCIEVIPIEREGEVNLFLFLKKRKVKERKGKACFVPM
jgi:hypothetical protein